jgi:hypothetical protein
MAWYKYVVGGHTVTLICPIAAQESCCKVASSSVQTNLPDPMDVYLLPAHYFRLIFSIAPSGAIGELHEEDQPCRSCSRFGSYSGLRHQALPASPTVRRTSGYRDSLPSSLRCEASHKAAYRHETGSQAVVRRLRAA